MTNQTNWPDKVYGIKMFTKPYSDSKPRNVNFVEYVRKDLVAAKEPVQVRVWNDRDVELVKATLEATSKAFGLNLTPHGKRAILSIDPAKIIESLGRVR